MRILDLALKDIKQILSDRKVAIMLVAMPILFTAFFGLLFGGSGKAEDPRLPVGVINQDPSSWAGPTLLELLETSDAVRPVVLAGSDATAAPVQVRDGKLAAAVTVPPGFGRAAWDGEEAELLVVVDRNDTSGLVASNAIDTAATRLLGAVQTARLSVAAYEARTALDAAAQQEYVDQAIALASSAWKNPPLTLAVEKASVASQEENSNAHNQSSPGLIVQSVCSASDAN